MTQVRIQIDHCRIHMYNNNFLLSVLIGRLDEKDAGHSSIVEKDKLTYLFRLLLTSFKLVAQRPQGLMQKPGHPSFTDIFLVETKSTKVGRNSSQPKTGFSTPVSQTKRFFRAINGC